MGQVKFYFMFLQPARQLRLALCAIGKNQLLRHTTGIEPKYLPHGCPGQNKTIPVLFKIEAVRAVTFILRKHAPALLNVICWSSESDSPNVDLICTQLQIGIRHSDWSKHGKSGHSLGILLGGLMMAFTPVHHYCLRRQTPSGPHPEC